MAGPSVTYTFSNSTTADATQVNQNFTDMINGATDGTKDYSINALTAASTATLNGNVVLGSGSTKSITVNGSLASTIPILTDASYDIGSSTFGLRSLYFGGNSQRVNIKASASMSATWTLTLPTTAGSAYQFLQTDGNGNASWVNKAPTEQIFLSGTGTYTTPAGVQWLRIRMIGGGGGGAGSGTGSGGAAGDGGNTTFGTTFLVANGGGHAVFAGSAGAGGSSSKGAGADGITLTGGSGVNALYNVAYAPGGAGASSPFGGGSTAAAPDNTGAGGGGGGVGATGTGMYAGPGGGAGGYIDVIVASPSGTYGYAVGAGGAAGPAGTSGFTGYAGGSGIIIVEEHYQ